MIEIIRQKILAVVGGFDEVSQEQVEVEPAQGKFGDFSTNIALRLGKKLNQSAPDIAQKIVDKLSKDSYFSKVNSVNGFINFEINEIEYSKVFTNIFAQNDDFSKNNLLQKIRYNIEFISANPTGPLHIGNCRGGFLGDAIANILEFCGAKVSREYYINDIGAQVLALGHSVLKDNEKVYAGEYIDRLNGQFPKELANDPKAVGSWAVGEVMNEIKKTVKRLGINFDEYFSESSLYPATSSSSIKILKEKGLIYSADGAEWFCSTKFGDDKDRVIIRENKEPTYFASDIAYIYHKLNRADRLIVLLGADHHGYVARMQAVAEAFGKEKKDLRAIVFQLVSLVRDGKPTKLSKRKGDIILADDLIDEIGLDAARYFFLASGANQHINIDLDIVKEKSANNPVFYIQYAYTRCVSVLSKSTIEPKKDLTFEGDELKLIKEIIRFPDLIMQIGKTFEVQLLPTYLRELAHQFHLFYEKNRVIGDTRQAERVAIISGVAKVLKTGLELLGISAPKSM